MDRKVVADDIERSCERRLANVTLSQKPNPKFHLKGSLFSLGQRFFIRIDSADPSPDRLPLVPISSSATPAIENELIFLDPSRNEFTFDRIVQFSNCVHLLKK
jgi:hypothetical protein